MPRYGEKNRKLKQLEAGGNVRPPKNWWKKVRPVIVNQYPMRDKREVDQVLGGIWNSYDTQTKEKIVREYQTSGRKSRRRP